MRHNLKGTNLDLTAEIRSYIDTKLAGLDALVRDQGAARTDVELEYLPSEEKTYRAELMLHNPGAEMAVVRMGSRGGTLHEAIDTAVNGLFEELSRSKKKRRGVFRRSAVKVKEYLRGWRTTI